MNCDFAHEHLAAYLARELPAAEHAGLEAHVAACPACQAELLAAQRVWHALGQLPAPEPSARLRPEFYAMLATFEAAPTPTSSLAGLWQWLRAFPLPRPAVRIAYSLSLLSLGIGAGYWLHTPPPPEKASQPQVAALAAQVGQLRQVLLLTLLENPSATERLRAVSYTKELPTPNTRVVSALLSTLNQDPNVNVRLATLEALAPLAHDPAVRLDLVRALPQQTSPLVQVALADLMAQLQERRSVPPLRKLLQRADLDATVKNKLEQTIQLISTGRPAAPSLPSPHAQAPPSSQPEPAAPVTS